MEFNTITRRIAEKSGIDASAGRGGREAGLGRVSSLPRLRGGRRRASAPGGVTGDLFAPRSPRPLPPQAGGRRAEAQRTAPSPPSRSPPRAPKPRASSKIDRSKYECVRTLARLKEWIARAHEVGVVAVDTETTSLDAMQAGLCGFSLALAPNEACYVPLAPQEGRRRRRAVRRRARAPTRSRKRTRCKLLKPLLEDKSVLKVAQNMKYDWLVFAQRGIEIAGYDDTMLISYVLDAGKGGHGMDDLAKRWLDHDTIHFADVAGSGKAQVTLRLRRHRQGDRIRRRGRRRDAAAVERAEAAACRRARRHRLRDAGARHAGGAGAHGAARHFHRPPGALTAVRRIRAEAGRARRRDQDARRRAAQSRLAQAARRHPVRQDEPARRHQDQDRAMVDRRARTGGPRRAGPRAAAQDSRLAAGVQAALDLYRGAADLRQPDDPPRAHLLRARRHLDRAAVVVGAEFAEHPGAHRGRPQDPPRLRRRARHEAGLGRLFADRAAAAVGSRRGAGAAQGVPGRRRHPRHDRVGNVRRAGEGHAERSAPARQGDQFRHHLRHLGLRPRRAARHRQERGRRLHQEIFRALPRHPRLHGRDARVLPRQRLCAHAVRPQVPLPRHQGRKSVDPLVQRARGDQRAPARLGRRHHPPRHDPHGSRARQGQAQRADAAAGARRTDLRGAGRRSGQDHAGGQDA